MPSPRPHGHWSLSDIETVALNLESLARDIYQTMSEITPSNPNQEYAHRLMNVLARLADAAENYTDSVYSGDDFIDSLNDLFYLEDLLELTEQTLDGYSKAHWVENEMREFRYHVDELLWVYRQNY